MKNIVLLIITGLLIISCKQQQNPSPSEVNGLTIDYIDHYVIHFDDGSSYDMSEKETQKIYYLVRHAEKDTVPKGDPRLSTKGVERSNRLAEIFSKTQLEAIFSTMTTRTLFTVDSLSNLKNMPILPYETKGFREINENIEQSLETHRVLIVGHSNSTPVLANHLYGEKAFNKTIDEAEYDNLYIITEDNKGSRTLLTLKF
jgi:phosphohistidine phosphatase SixA